MRQKLIIASQNSHKIKEFSEILSPYGFDVIGRDEAGLSTAEIEETGKTFEENSFIKAKAIFDECGVATLADDSGLCVDFLKGEPGVYSSRFAHENATDKENNQKLLYLLKDAPKERCTAKFVSVITLILANGEKIVARGECKGNIQERETGKNGFGYDPLFIPDGYSVSMAVLDPSEKNKISHRARAIEELLKKINVKLNKKGE